MSHFYMGTLYTWHKVNQDQLTMSHSFHINYVLVKPLNGVIILKRSVFISL